ncbi:MAG TPA: dihydrofolate reductase family protein [Mucilaginibacter sp.]|jgi:dihydrofolate reductase|nr:dihydrofolate reductase family protein [Mucilaginibacter sp.]
MRQLIATEWVSLNGIFDSGSFEQWFNPYHSDSRAKYIQDCIANCDVMLYGRDTYQMLYPYWSSFKNNEMGVADKLNKVKKYVVSSKLKQAPWENTTIINKDIIAAVEAIKNEVGGDILLQGSGTLLQSLLKANLVDELKLLVHPHLASSGKRLFTNDVNTGFELNTVQQLDKGVIALSYKRVK